MTAERDALAELVASLGEYQMQIPTPIMLRVRAALAAHPAPLPRGDSITFDALVAHGLANGANVVNGMPWSWNFYGIPVTHENDNCYLLCTTAGIVRVERPTAAPAQERQGTHWDGCATDGGPRHYDCALRLIEQQARALAARDAALTLIMRNADAAKEPCGTDPESAAAIRNGKLASLAQIAAQMLGLVCGPDLIDAARAKVKP